MSLNCDFRVDSDPALLRFPRAARQAVGQVPAERPRHPTRARQVCREHDQGNAQLLLDVKI